MKFILDFWMHFESVTERSEQLARIQTQLGLMKRQISIVGFPVTLCTCLTFVRWEMADAMAGLAYRS